MKKKFRTRLEISLMIILTTIFLGLVFAGQFIDNSQSDFDSGVYFQTEYNSSFVQLSTNVTLRETQSVADMTGNTLLYHMDESSGNIIDYSGHGNDGIYVGGLYGEDGRLNKSLGFNGSTDNINIGNNSALVGTNISISAWIYWEGDSGVYEPIVTQSDGAWAGYYLYVYSNNGHVSFWLDSAEAITSYNLTQNVWHYVVGTHNDTDLAIYVDGALKDTTPLVGTGNNKTGYVGFDDVSDYFNGNIDEVVIWNRTLSSTEVKNIYDKQVGNYIGSGNYTSQIFGNNSILKWNNISWLSNSGELLSNVQSDITLNMTGNVLLYHMNEGGSGASRIIIDTSGEGNNGTTYDSTDGTVSGKFDKGNYFDGAGDYIDCGNKSSLDITGAITIEMWVKPNTVGGSSGYLISKNDQDANDHQYAIYTTGGSAVYYGAGSPTTPVGVVPYNIWTNVVFTRTTGGIGQIYINGQASGNPAACAMPTKPTFPVRLGCRWNLGATPHLFFNGTIDEVAIWNRTLSADEILNIYKRGITKLNLSVQNCSILDCSDGTWQDVNNTPPINLNLVSDYFQYKFEFETTNNTYSPFLYNVTMDYEPTTLFIEILSPQDIIYSNATQLLNISATDIYLDTTWYNWNGTNYTYTTESNITFDEGANTLIAWANNSWGEVNSTSVIFTIDTSSPNVSLISPENKTSTTNTSLIFTFNATDTSLKNATLYIWDSSGNLFGTNSKDITGTFNESTLSLGGFGSGNYTWNILVYDEVGHGDWGAVNWTFEIIDIDKSITVLKLNGIEGSIIITPDENVSIDVEVLNYSSGNVSLYMGGVLVKSENSSTLNFTTNYFSPGTYVVLANYSGDEFTSASNVTWKIFSVEPATNCSTIEQIAIQDTAVYGKICSIISATTSYYFEQNKSIVLTLPIERENGGACLNCSAYLTIRNQDGSYFISADVMNFTNGIASYNIDADGMSILGKYFVSIRLIDNELSKTGSVFFNYEITPTGREDDQSGLKAVFVSALSIMVLFFLFLAWNFKHKWKLKVFFQMMALFFGIIILNTARMIAEETYNLGTMGIVAFITGMAALSFLLLYFLVFYLIDVFQLYRKKNLKKFSVTGEEGKE